MKNIFCKVLKYNIGVWLFGIIILVANFFERTAINYLLSALGFFYFYLIYMNVLDTKKYSYLIVFQILGIMILPLIEIYLSKSILPEALIFLLGLPSVFYAYNIYKTLISLPQTTLKNNNFLLIAIFVPVFSFKINPFLIEKYCKN